GRSKQCVDCKEDEKSRAMLGRRRIGAQGGECMDKVLIDRELLERAADVLGSQSFSAWDEIAEQLRAFIAQPAESEGVRDYLTEFAEGEVEAKTAIEELQDALSAVTAERDRLQRNLNFTEQWYAERFERLTDLGKSAG